MTWKANWNESRPRWEQWWQGLGMIAHVAGLPAEPPHDGTERLPGRASLGGLCTDPPRWVQAEHQRLARQAWPLDTLPIANFNTGPGSLALYLGCEPGFAETTVWFEPTLQELRQPETAGPLSLDTASRWWQLAVQTLTLARQAADGQYLVGMPDLVENVDILSALRDPQTLMIDMIERPGWVEQAVWQINDAWKQAFDELYEIIRLPDGSQAYGPFTIWGPGRTAKVQCDAAAMFGPAMFEQFVVPPLTDQCDWLDFSMFHLDGEECIVHLDHLLAIDSLNAIQWTPKSMATGQGGGNPRWYELYRRIKAGGKAVQIIQVKPDEVAPLLDAIGPEGVFIRSSFASPVQAEAMIAEIQKYRQ